VSVFIRRTPFGQPGFDR